MSNQKYSHNVPYPDLVAAIKEIKAEIDAASMTTAERCAAIHNLHFSVTAKIAKQMDQYNFAEREVHTRFNVDMECEHDMVDFPTALREKIHALAWERGHSAGWEDAENSYGDFVELARLAFDAGKAKE